MDKTFKFRPDLILRTPAYPFRSQFDESFIRDCLANPGFRESLYLASPRLHDECVKWHQGTITDPKRTGKLLKALTKYYLRMSSRCTPFGLFAGCSAISWGDVSRVRMGKGQYYRHTRLDMQYLSALAKRLSTDLEIRAKLRYFPNSSIYQVGDEIRYVEYQYVDDNRLYQISSVMASDYLVSIIAACEEGLLMPEMVEHLGGLDPTITQEETRDFIIQLIESQLLVNELEPSVTGQELLYQILGVLERVAPQAPGSEMPRIIQTLRSVDERLKTLDARMDNDVEQYEHVVKQLESLDVPISKDRLFQVDLSVSHAGASLDETLQDDLIEALGILNQLTTPLVVEELEAFKARFVDRYGDKEVPLLEVLDEENGIGYSNGHGQLSSMLTDDLILSGNDGKGQITGVDETQRFIHNKLIEAQKRGSYTVEITAQEVKPAPLTPDQLPPSMGVLFRVVDQGAILLEGGTGSSAVNLLGRFAHINPDIGKIIQQVTAFEQQTNPQVALAEINHLPQSRTGNILCRPVFRDFEIAYLTNSPLPRHMQIPIRDLLVSVKNNRVTLRSQQLNKVVIPRLGTAHNCAYQSLPLYHFLCDMQSQGLQAGLAFNWEPMFADIKFLPRVTYKRTILHPATWCLKAEDLHDLLESSAANLADCFRAFQTYWKLPRYFVLVEGDNELLVDAENLLTVETWCEAIKNHNSIKLKEFLFDPSASVVTDELNRPYVNQFIALLMKEKPSYTAQANSAFYPYTGSQHKYWLGSDWLYYKFYCGVKASDRVLTEAIKPLVEALKAANLMDKWFFVRYADSNPHLRVRFHLTDPGRIGEVILTINQYLEPYLVSQYIWKSQTDTYVQEIERYGHQAMEMTETLFYHDSTAAVAIIEQTAGDADDHLRWLWGIRSVDELLNAFSFTLFEKQGLIGQMKEAFGREFKMNKSLKLQLDTKYRSNRNLIRQFMDPVQDIAHQYPDVFDCIRLRNQYIVQMIGQVRELAGKQHLEVGINSLVSDYIHMLLNRLLPVNQRLHEMIIYDFLFKQYQGMIASRKT